MKNCAPKINVHLLELRVILLYIFYSQFTIDTSRHTRNYLVTFALVPCLFTFDNNNNKRLLDLENVMQNSNFMCHFSKV